ncbi:hypothetical protein DFJ58DRAFT_841391 [Suillus subalutaceus]|uniref:uncharacterized protein n=1 Tax=Suillus subalutaceus TaxID=48586 RepID=UPI001B863712|nr:uncharacterized protein DFJ58DRAFT_841391 [Suillus subalutaceus]KAG1854480.1 hypothetical protein DFJ58DRAFT_841391 [Suillus subalutaceus]
MFVKHSIINFCLALALSAEPPAPAPVASLPLYIKSPWNFIGDMFRVVQVPQADVPNRQVSISQHQLPTPDHIVNTESTREPNFRSWELGKRYVFGYLFRDSGRNTFVDAKSLVPPGHSTASDCEGLNNLNV